MIDNHASVSQLSESGVFAGSDAPSFDSPADRWASRYEASGVAVGSHRYVKSPRAGLGGGAAQRHTAEAGAGALVPHTISVDATEVVFDQKTGEIQYFTAAGGCAEFVQKAVAAQASEDAKHAARTERFQLQRIARDVLIDVEPPAVGAHVRRSRDAVKHPAFDLMHGVPSRAQLAVASGKDLTITRLSPSRPAKRRVWRVCTCSWRALDNVKIMYSSAHRKAHFKNLAVCGSVWTCPICAAKVGQRRGDEIQAAMDAHHSAGGITLMVTLTFSHSRNDVLKELVGDSKRSHGLTSALQRWRDSRTYGRIKKELGMLGLIRNLEVTHSENAGWHPHVHELWFVDGGLSGRKIASIKSALFDKWKAACSKAGLGLPNRERGLDIRIAWTAAEYMSKFGTERKWSPQAEMTRSHTKRGRERVRRAPSMTPFDLLRCIGSGSPRAKRCRQLFREYAYAFFGRAQLFWTKGLKALFGIVDKDDDALAREEAEDAVEVTTISKSRWKRILSLRYEARGMLLKLAETGGRDAVERFLFQTFGHDFASMNFRLSSYPRAPLL